jgi:N-acetylneuraminic acid mutarotase
MKKFLLLFIFVSIIILPQQVPTTLSEVFKGQIILDYSESRFSSAGVWSTGKNMPSPRYYGASVAYTKNDTTWLYIFGGDTTGNGDATSSCLRYNVQADTWEYIDSLPIPIRVNSAARLGDKVYVTGGFEAKPPVDPINKFYEYDLNTKLWAEQPDLPESMFYHKSFGYNDSLIYIIGGVRSDSMYYSNSVLLYNTNTLQFREADPLPEQRANFALAVIDNRFFITGGLFNNDSLSNKTIAATINPFNNSSISYIISEDSTTHYPIQVHSHFAYPSGSDSIIFFGGSNTNGFNPINISYSLITSEISYNTLTNVSFRATAFQSGYSYSSINPGSDSVLYVVVAGGVTPGPAISGNTWIYRDSLAATSVNNISGNIPSEFELFQNYPNPFNPSTIIQFTLPEQSFVMLEVYNSIGEKISTIVSDFFNAGNYKYEFNAAGKNLSSGVYFYRITAGEFVATKKFLFLK